MITIDSGVICIDGVSVTKLAEQFGTPLYIYSEEEILKRIRKLKSSFTEKYENTHIAYACKAFSTLYIVDIMHREGLWLDVVSGGELYTALKAGFPADRIEFNGNNKSLEELEYALESGVSKIIVDSLDEMKELEILAKERSKKPGVLIRINPEVLIDTHHYIVTGGKDSKFGVTTDPESLFPAVDLAVHSPHLHFLGYHFHLGSQLKSNESHMNALKGLFAMLDRVFAHNGAFPEEINIGGGFGVRYIPTDAEVDVDSFLRPVMEGIETYFRKHRHPRPHIAIEPGRYIVAEAGYQLYTVGMTKTLPSGKRFVSIDGGMTDNIRPGLYGASYYGIVANKADHPKNVKVDISGKCCESTDILIKDLDAAPAERGDLFLVLSTGAYGYSMASNYNKLRIPAVVVIRDGEPHVIVERQSYMDLIARERQLAPHRKEA
ncbi:MAG: diaminopimelate decarboxylase [Bacillota bacterium]|nr:diaminopimelate decarboxylase [Bacillota bacterium]